MPTDLGALRDAALDQSYASIGPRRIASVHEFYRYPARFSPAFARAAVRAFTKAGDLVVDPFVGGGTSLVEARLLGRGAVGADISELACFVTRAKTTVYGRASLNHVAVWAESLRGIARVARAPSSIEPWMTDGYLRNIDDPGTWRIRNVISQALEGCNQLGTGPAKQLARCAILGTGQWALDMRDHVPSVAEFRDRLVESVVGMHKAAGEYSRCVRDAGIDSSKQAGLRYAILNARLPGLASDPRLVHLPKPQLILTSPPYPGVYVNYHRWKVQGRRETPAPFWIADCLDGSGLAAYTMSARSNKSLDIYFGKLEAAWIDLVLMMSKRTWLVQMVGFSDRERQLPRYLQTMRKAGLQEVFLPELANQADGRLWRDVPGRRWWVRAGDRVGTAPHTASEVLLVHRRS